MGRKVVAVISLILLVGCRTTVPILYQAKAMEVSDAMEIAEEITWSQHPAFRPDEFLITEKFLAWSYGVTSRSRGFATAIGDTGIAVGSSSSTTRNLGDRAYYRSISDVRLLSWKRKLKQWYVVSLVDSNGGSRIVLRTRSLGDAELFTDAMTAIVDHFKGVQE